MLSCGTRAAGTAGRQTAGALMSLWALVHSDTHRSGGVRYVPAFPYWCVVLFKYVLSSHEKETNLPILRLVWTGRVGIGSNWVCRELTSSLSGLKDLPLVLLTSIVRLQGHVGSNEGSWPVVPGCLLPVAAVWGAASPSFFVTELCFTC